MPSSSIRRTFLIVIAAFLTSLGVALWAMGWLPASWTEVLKTQVVWASPVASGAKHDGPTNRLAKESSPYLQLHAHNPVDWYPWAEEALKKARLENKPIFLSVGYSTCYWCHVMERESFSDPEIAAFLNEHFVAIKVDREERPDLDEIYMLATQLMTRRGGWPNSVFLTPSLEPFYAGTYFPPEDRSGTPGFRTLLVALERSWREENAKILEHAGRLAEAMKHVLEPREVLASSQSGASTAPAKAALANLESRFDAKLGGFGRAPKFPTPSNLLLLLDFESPAADRMLRTTLDHMARGGIYDQIGGGFHRYSTDAQWLVPHFEKMLYDNGSLLEIYGRWYERTGDAQAARVLRQTAAFLSREMTSKEGALWSAIDAETNAREGAFYVWTQAEITAALNIEQRTFAAPLLGFAGEPSFRDPHGSPEEPPAHVLHLPQALAAQAASLNLPEVALDTKLEAVRQQLLSIRDGRERPLTDDKIMADWNGLGIAGLAIAGRALDDVVLIKQARRAAQEVLRRLRPDKGPLRHVWRADGSGARLDAFLVDYAYLIHGLLALEQATGEKQWLDAAIVLSREQVERLWDAEGGGFFVAGPNPDLLTRSKDSGDGARPSGNGQSMLNFLEIYERTGDKDWLDRAAAGLRAFSAELEKSPAGHMTLARAARRLATIGDDNASPVASLEEEGRSKVQAEARWHESDQDGWRAVTVGLEIAEGWHVNAQPASDEFLIATELRAAPGDSLRKLHYPEAKVLRTEWSEQSVDVYEGEVEISAQWLRAESRSPDSAAELTLIFQACDASRCLPKSEIKLQVNE